MNECDNNFDIEELTRRIEESIKKIEERDNNTVDLSDSLPVDDTPAYTTEEIDKLINEIDERLSTLKEQESKIDIDLDELTKEINEKLDSMEEKNEDSLEKTLYDLSEISTMIKEAISKIDKDKEKKRKKAMYCDLARKKNNKNRNKYKNNKKKSTK